MKPEILFGEMQFKSQHGDIIFADAEYLNANLGKGRPEQHHWKEVTQIGATRYKFGKEVATFNMNVRPTVYRDRLNSEQWDAYTEITGVSKDTVMSYTTHFLTAWEKFVHFCGNDSVVIMLGDRNVYTWNFTLLGEDSRVNELHFSRLKPVLPPELSHYWSGQLHTLVNQHPPEGSAHDALFDARSMALFCLRWKNKHNTQIIQ